MSLAAIIAIVCLNLGIYYAAIWLLKWCCMAMCSCCDDQEGSGGGDTDKRVEEGIPPNMELEDRTAARRELHGIIDV